MKGPLQWKFLPIIAGIVPMFGLAVTYAIAKTNCHVEKWYFPYVSYTGARFPELLYFGLLLNLEGFIGLIVVFIAWRYYRYLGERSILNNITLIVGSFSSFGVIIVGNFPVTYSKPIHYVGASLAFILGTLYTMLTAKLSIKTSSLSKVKNINRIKIVRIFLAATMLVSFISICCFAILKSFLNNYYKKEEMDESELLKPLENGDCPFYPNKTRGIDLFGSIMEWILTLGMLTCLALYYYEFQEFSSVKVILKQKLENNLNVNQNTNQKFIRNGLQTMKNDNRRDLLNNEHAVLFNLLQKNEMHNKREVKRTIENFHLDSFQKPFVNN